MTAMWASHKGISFVFCGSGGQTGIATSDGHVAVTQRDFLCSEGEVLGPWIACIAQAGAQNGIAL